MVQFVKSNSFGTRFSDKFGPAFQKQIDSLLEEKKEARKEQRAQDRLLAVEEKKGEMKGQANQKTALEDAESQAVLEKYFGPEFGEVYMKLTEGGKTRFFEEAMETVRRQGDVGKIIQKYQDAGGEKFKETVEEAEQISPEGEEIEEEVELTPEGRLPKNYKVQDFSERPKGWSPKAWDQERKTWRKENAPLFEKATTELRSEDRDMMATKNLQRLNNTRKVGEGFQRLLINPKTNEFYGLAKLAGVENPEAQEWAKEIARFGNRAKDAFGSRVTNFDLMQYLKQFPSILNTYEGRKRILEMMEINYKLDQLYNNALVSVFNKYKLSGISQEDAKEEARNLISKQKDALVDKYFEIDSSIVNSTGPSSSANTEEGERPSLAEIFK